MAKESSSAKGGGISALGLLGVVFVTMKLLGLGAVAGWSWWWVTAPFWGGLALVLAIFLVVLIFVGIGSLFFQR